MAIIEGTPAADTLLGTEDDDTILGLAGNDIIRGNGGNDRIEGGDGGDSINGGQGADTMIGGNGNDSYVVDDAGDVVTETATGGYDRVNAGISYTLGAHVEELALLGTVPLNGVGNTLANVITGNIAPNILLGGAGNDTLRGMAGNDTLKGGIGNDVIEGGDGSDTIIGEAGTDTLRGGAGDDRFLVLGGNEIGAGEVIDGGDGIDVLSAPGGSMDISQAILIGIEGVSADEILLTAAQLNGMDQVSALAVRLTAAGSVEITGLFDVVDLFGSAGDDMLDLRGLTVATRLSLGVSGGDGNDMIFGSIMPDRNFQDGGAGDDILIGFDNLLGGEGSDVLTALGGNEYLAGGGGQDSFEFVTGDGTHYVHDFSQAEGDIMRLFGSTGGGVYIGTDAFTASGITEVRVVSIGSHTLTAGGGTVSTHGAHLSVDMDGDGWDDMALYLANITSAGQLATANFDFA